MHTPTLNTQKLLSNTDNQKKEVKKVFLSYYCLLYFLEIQVLTFLLRKPLQ